MATPSQDLFDLIQSMTMAERRHFSLSAEKKNDSAHIKLYHLICKQKDYNEKELLSILTKKEVADFSKLKRYLYDAILKSLHRFHEKNSPLLQDINTISKLHILGQRGLLKQRDFHYKRARQSFFSEQKMDLFSLCLRTQADDINLFREGALEDFGLQANTAISQLDRQINLQLLYNRAVHAFTIWTKKEASDKKKAAALINKILNSPYLNLAKTKTPTAICYYYRTLSFCYRVLEDRKKILQVDTSFLDYLESLAKKEQPHYLFYLSAYNLLLSSYFRHRNKNNFFETFRKFKLHFKQNQANIRPSLTNSGLLIVQITQELNGVMLSRDYKALQQLDTLIFENLSHLKTSQQQFSIFQFINNLAICYFLFQDFTSCIRWASYICGHKKKKTTALFFNYANLLSLICFLEKEDYVLVSTRLKAIKRFSNNEGFDLDAMDMFASLIKKLRKTPGDKEKRTHLKKAYALSTEIIKSSKLPGSELIHLWLEWKVTRKNLFDLYKKF